MGGQGGAGGQGGCEADAECDDFQICDDGQCRLGCRADGACDDGQICDDGQCRVGCRGDDACGDGQICDEGQCQAGCRDDAACDDFQICDEGQCVRGCRDDGQCDDGQICDEAQCVVGCRDDNQCGDGQACVGGACQPAGGQCGGLALAIGVNRGDSSQAANTAQGACGGNGPDVLHRFAPPRAGVWCVSTAGTGFDTLIHARRNGCDAADEVACDDDGGPGLQSELELQVQAGDVFYVYLDAFSANGSGPYQLTVGEGRCDEQACQADDACGAGQICEGGACVAGCRDDDGCGFFEVCRAGQCVPEAECQVDGDCADGLACILGECADIGCAADADCPGDTNLCSDGECVDIGGCTVDGNCARDEQCVQGACLPRPVDCAGDADCGDQQLCFSGQCLVAQCRVNADCDDGRECVLTRCVADADFSSCDFPSGLNDTDTALINVGLNNLSPDPFRCGDVGGGDSKFAWRPRGGQYCIHTDGSTVDTVVSVWSGACRNGRQLACNDDGEGLLGGQSALEFETDPNVDNYWIAVDSREGSRGAVRLRIDRGPCELPAPCDERLACYYGRTCVDGQCVQCAHDGHCENPRHACVDGACRLQPPGTCAEPIELLRSGPHYGITQGRSQGGNDIRCAFGSRQAPDSFLRFEAPAAGDWCFDPAGTSFRPVILLYEPGDCFTAGACRQGPLTWRADRAGDSTLILMDGASDDESGAFALTVTRGACQ